MSFTSEVKQEIAMNELHACCVKAELSALVQMLCSINFSINGMDLRIKCEHRPTANRIYNMIKERYQARMQFSVMKKMNLKKNISLNPNKVKKCNCEDKNGPKSFDYQSIKNNTKTNSNQ